MVAVSRLVPRCDCILDWMTRFRNRIPIHTCRHQNNKVNVSIDCQETGQHSHTIENFLKWLYFYCGFFSLVMKTGSTAICWVHTHSSNAHRWKEDRYCNDPRTHSSYSSPYAPMPDLSWHMVLRVLDMRIRVRWIDMKARHREQINRGCQGGGAPVCVKRRRQNELSTTRVLYTCATV